MLHSLMVKSRKRHGVVLHAEHKYIRGLAPESLDRDGKPTDDGYYNLHALQKVRVLLKGGVASTTTVLCLSSIFCVIFFVFTVCMLSWQ